MAFNKYEAYAILSTNEACKKEDVTKVLNLFDDLKRFNTEKEVREWLKRNWNVQSDANYLVISDDINISIQQGQNFFNLTLREGKKVKSYNYLSERRV